MNVLINKIFIIIFKYFSYFKFIKNILNFFIIFGNYERRNGEIYNK